MNIDIIRNTTYESINIWLTVAKCCKHLLLILIFLSNIIPLTIIMHFKLKICWNKDNVDAKFVDDRKHTKRMHIHADNADIM